MQISILKELIPPIILKFTRKVFPRKVAEKKLNSTRIYASYSEALNNCLTKFGYEEDEIANVVYEKTKIFKEKIDESEVLAINSSDAFGLLPILKILNKNEITIIDLGGACGAHYFIYKKIIGEKVRLNWFVIETKEMCKYGKQLENGELKFRDNFKHAIKEIGKPDMLYTSGTIQCVEKPYDFLSLIVKSQADYILFNRLGFTMGEEDVITIHKSMLSWNGIGDLPKGFVDKEIEYPFSFIQKKKFDTIINENYRCIIEFDDKSGMFPVASEPIIGIGLLCERNNRNPD